MRREMIALPARLIVRTYLVRSAKLWLAARGLITTQVLFAAQDPAFAVGPVFELLFGAGPMIVSIAATVALGLVETHRRHEWALLGNLGIGTRDLMPLLVLPAAAGEVLIHIIYAVVRLAA